MGQCAVSYSARPQEGWIEKMINYELIVQKDSKLEEVFHLKNTVVLQYPLLRLTMEEG